MKSFQKLELDLEKEGCFLIKKMNVPLPVPSKDFDAENSQIAIGLTVAGKYKWEPTRPNDPQWNQDNRAFTPKVRVYIHGVKLLKRYFKDQHSLFWVLISFIEKDKTPC